MTRVRVEPRSCDQGRRKNDAFALSATLRTKLVFFFCLTSFLFQRDVEISVRCKAYARNIVDDDRMQIGYYSFKIKIES